LANLIEALKEAPDRKLSKMVIQSSGLMVNEESRLEAGWKGLNG
jgi:hypothetical protein